MLKQRTLIIAAAGFVLIAAATMLWFWDAIPGTLYIDRNGVPRGTGVKTYSYKSGSLQLREEFRRGQLVRSEWFKSDGRSIQITEWENGTGTGVYLREDGSIRRRVTYVNGLAHGTSTYYAEDGSVLGEAEFQEGIRVSGYDPKAASEPE